MRESKTNTEEQYVIVEYEYPTVGLTCSVGTIQESANHIVLVWQIYKGRDIASYIVIPKRLIKKITKTEFTQ